MRCSARNCTNDTRKRTKTDGITFHKFPKDPDHRNAWIEALGLLDWEPSEKSVVCSEHFQQDRFYGTKCSFRKIKSSAVPVPVNTSCDLLDGPATLKVCRICLSMDVKMYDLSEHRELGLMYEQVTGLTTEDKLPQKLCWECAARLSSANTFRSKALRTQEILIKKLDFKGYITIRDVKTLSRAHNHLKSTLAEKIHEVNYFNLHINDNVKIERDNDNDFNDDLDYDDNDDSNDVKSFEINIKDEMNNEISFIDEYPVIESDDNKTLIDVYKKSDVIENQQFDSDDDSPSAIIDRYKKSKVIRKKKTTGVDESLFTITKITYEEQIAEVERRKEAKSYKCARYKCTSCYRGFQLQDLYQAHIIRHSEQSGAFECFICKMRCKSARALRHHLTGQHTEQFSCKGCHFVTRNRCVAREHQRWHAGTKYECKYCFLEFDKPTTYKNHVRIKHPCDFVCELCGYTFVSKKGVEVHKNRKHCADDKNMSPDGPYCEVCEVRFLSKEAHTRHLKLSSKHISDAEPNRIRNDSQFMNKEPIRRNERRPVIHRHSPAMSEHSAGSPVTCEQCGTQLSDLRLYVQHFKRVHPDKNRTKYSAKAPFMCEQCGRIFQSATLLKEHMWVHTGKKHYKCDLCEKTFTNKKSLVIHINAHSGTTRMYACPICGKNFSFFNNRRRHMLIHTGLKPFKCDTCEKCFKTYDEKRSHVDHVHLKKPWPKRVRNRKEEVKIQDAEDSDD